jgi:hypothetical protein
VDDDWEGAGRAVDVAGDGRVVVAVRAPEACVVAAAAGGDCVAAEIEEFSCYFTGGVHVECRESEAGEDDTDCVHWVG